MIRLRRYSLLSAVAWAALIPAAAVAAHATEGSLQETQTSPLPLQDGEADHNGTATSQRGNTDPAAEASPADIVVTGIRQSLRASQDVKRKSDYIVDAITQEDVGKFPNANVAEALQQIPGVALSRNGGEGQQVTVRGLGPAFNTVLLNGRRLATDATDRSFNFDTISSDLLGGTELFKTSNVALQEGGIGSTINLKTLRPFDLKKAQFVLSARGLYDERANKLTPQVFGLYGGTFADGRIGVILSASYQRRKSINESASSGSLQPLQITANNLDLFADGKGNGPGQYFIPEKYVNDRNQDDRERLGFNATVQAAITDNLTLTVDGLYSKFKVKGDGIEKAQFVNASGIVPGSIITDPNNAVTKFTYVNGPEFVKTTYNRPTETWLFGGNLAWNVSSRFTTALDVSASQATNKAGGKDQYFVIHGPDTQITYDNTQGYDTPVGTDGLIVGYDPALFPAGSPQAQAAPPVGSTWDRNNLNGYRSWWTTRQGDSTKDRIFEARLDNKYTFEAGWLDSLRFGAAYSDQKKDIQAIGAGDVGWSNYGANGIPLPGSLFYVDNHPSFLSGANTPDAGKFINFDGDAYINYLLSPAALSLRDQVNGLPPGTSAAQILPRGYDAVLQQGASYSVQEKVLSFYAELTLKGNIAGMPLVVNLGGRYTRTRENATSMQKVLLDILNAPGSGGTQYVSVFSNDFRPVEQRNNYNNFLPSINAKLNVTDKFVLRAAASKSLTRPDLGALNPVIVYPETLRPGNLVASGGNGNLKPYTSTNLDVSAEWYYSRTGYISVSYFHKKVDGLIVNSIVQTPITIANSQGIADSSISGNQAQFNLSSNINLGSINVSGVEIAAQHTFSYLPSFLKNLGVLASITLPKSNRPFDRKSFNNNGAFPGLSNSYFVTGFYDDGRLEARVSWARRDTYYNGLISNTEPVYVLGSSQWDARIGFNINEHLQIFADAFNFTDTPTRAISRYSTEFVSFQQTGPRYDGGIRLKF